MRHHNLILTLQHECQCPEFTANPARNVMVNHSCNDLLIRNDPFQIFVGGTQVLFGVRGRDS